MKSRLYMTVADTGGVETGTRSDKGIAVDVGRIALGELGKCEGCQLKTKRAPVPLQLLWQAHDLVPRAIDREGVEVFHRSAMGIDQDHRMLIKRSSRISLADKRVGAWH